MYKPIENYGIIGDLYSIALVGLDGSIDWCCLPHFDSPSIFASILDHKKGGFFKISPEYCTVNKQMYLADTNILLTRFLNPDGVGEVVDFMPIESRQDGEPKHHQIVRQIRVVRGTLKFKVECQVSFDYGRTKHKTEIKDHGIIFSTPKEMVGLTTPPIHISEKGKKVEGFITLHEGEEATFVLRYCAKGNDAHILAPRYNTKEGFKETVGFWRRWISKCNYQGRWREMVRRSALTLKLLTFEPTGAIVAAPTTSLPEVVGGSRNWDYRYTWIRDAAFTVYGFIRLGLTSEAEAFMKWIDQRAHEETKDGALQIMYGIRGEHQLTESELTHFEGYKGSAPVRIGNAAYKQLQLDIYGELMDSVYLSNKYSQPISYDLWTHLRNLLEYVCKNWTKRDEGIWETRGGRKHFVYSKLMCWVALDRGLRLAEKRSFPANRSKWLKTRDAIYEEIMEKGWNKKKKYFTQHYETDALDASNLIMPLTFFISPTDPRMLSTLDATHSTLASDSLVHRYQFGTDGLSGKEGTFSMCSFWLVECLTRAGRLDEARLLFEKMLSYANHLGLFAEEIGPTGEALGNFPQAFTHLGLISSAWNLDKKLG